MNKLTKYLLLAAITLYVISPLDAAPGPVDDAIVIALGLLANSKLHIFESERR